MRNEHHHWSLMFADERTRDLNIFLNVDHQLKRRAKFEFCSDYISIKSWGRNYTGRDSIPKVFYLWSKHAFVYILNTVSLYFITRVAFLVIVRLKKDCIFCLQNTCNYYDGLWQYQAEFSNNHCNTINNTPEKKTYDNDISDSCWFNYATIIMENLTMIFYHNVVEAAMYIIWCYEVLYCRILGQLLVINAWNKITPHWFGLFGVDIHLKIMHDKEL